MWDSVHQKIGIKIHGPGRVEGQASGRWWGQYCLVILMVNFIVMHAVEATTFHFGLMYLVPENNLEM